MNTWIVLCKRQAMCKFCGKPIVKDTFMVKVKMLFKKKEEGEDKDPNRKRWWFLLRFHPQCWIDQGIAAIRARPVTETRGRKRIPMTDATKSTRWKIMMRRASIIQRLKKATLVEPYNIDKIIHLGGMLDELKNEIEEQGGVPKSWE